VDDPKERTWLDWIPLICFGAFVALALLAAALVYSAKGTPLDRLTILVGYVTLLLLFFFGLMVLFEMARGRIDLALLLSEPGVDGKGSAASMSRFQLLIFTFVIALSLFLITVSAKKFPTIPAEVLTLLGISASTYAVSKGIQASRPELTKGDGGPSAPAGGAPITTKVQDAVTGRTTTTVHDPVTGQTTTTVHDPTAGQTTTTVHKPTSVQTTTTVQPPPPGPPA
jgi:hypothetical protein